MTAIASGLTTARSLSRPHLRSFREVNYTVVVGLSALAAAAFSLLCQLRSIESHPLGVATTALATATLVASGVHLLSHQHRRSFGQAMILCALLWSTQFIGSWGFGPAALVAGLCSQAFYVVGAAGSLSYPADLDHRPIERIAVIYIAVSALEQYLLATLSALPSTYGLSSSNWWVSIAALQAHQHALYTAATVISIVGPVPFAFAIAARARRMRPMDRAVLLPVGVTAVFVGAFSVSLGTSQFYATPNTGYVIESLLVSMIGLSVITILSWQNQTHAQVAKQLSLRFAKSSLSVLSIQQALRDELKDPDLSIFYWSERESTYKDCYGFPVVAAAQDDDAYVRELRNVDGSPLAVVYADKFLARHEDIVDTALSTSTVALQNARLHGEALHQLAEAEKSRGRVASAAMSERQRIERDLHDGVQQRLLALSTRLGTLGAVAGDHPELKTRIKSINDDLRATNVELRELVHGIMPTELRQFGLKTALEEVARDLPVETKTLITDARFNSTIETTAYFVACEALTNAVKHSNASLVTVEGTQNDGDLIVTITDDGSGNASSDGSGLVGLRDRLAAVNGRLTIESEAGHGTTIQARIPVL